MKVHHKYRKLYNMFCLVSREEGDRALININSDISKDNSWASHFMYRLNRIIPIPSLFIALSIPFTFVPSSNATCEELYNINDALYNGLRFNYEVRQNLNDLEQSRLIRAKAFTGFLPSIAGNYNSTQNYPNGVNVSELDMTGRIPQSQSMGEIVITQNIFNGGSDMASYSAADLRLSATRLDFAEKVRNIMLKIATVYQDVLLKRKQYEVYKRNSQALKIALDDARTRFSLGVVSRIDLMQADTEYQSAIYSEQAALAALQGSVSDFCFNVGIDPPKKMADIDVTSIEIPSSSNEFLKNVMLKNQSIRGARFRIFASQKDVLAAGGRMLPNVSISASKNSANPQDLAVNPGFNGNKIALNVNVPIFQQGAEYVGIKDARRAYRASKDNYKKIRMNIWNESSKSWSRYIAAKSQLNSTGANAIKARETLEAMRLSFSLGRKSMTDLLQAQNALLKAELDKLDNEFNYRSTILAMRVLMSDIDKVYNVTNHNKANVKNISYNTTLNEKPISNSKSNTEKLKPIDVKIDESNKNPNNSNAIAVSNATEIAKGSNSKNDNQNKSRNSATNDSITSVMSSVVVNTKNENITNNENNRVNKVNDINKMNNVDKVNNTTKTGNINKIDNANKVNKVNKVDKVNKMNKVINKMNKIDKVGKAVKANKMNKEMSKANKINKANKSNKVSKANKANKINKANKVSKTNKANNRAIQQS